MADIFREVDEELRREGFEKVWRRYGRYIIGAAALAVLATAGYVGWQRYTESQSAERARQYEAAMALVQQPDMAAALPTLQALGAGSDGYATLARLQEAALQAKAGNTAAALSIYDKLSTDASVDRAFPELAIILLALQTLDTAAPAELTARLAPLTAADNPWRHSALELTGLLAKRSGDVERARQIFAGLADDLDAPQALRGRAAELLAALKE